MRALGSRGMLELIERVRPDVIVSVYPLTTEVLGGLRRRGKLDIPVVAGDHRPRDDALLGGAGRRPPSAHSSGVGSRRCAGSPGDETDVAGVHGLTRPEFAQPVRPE